MNSVPLIASDTCVCDLSTLTLTKDSISDSNSGKSLEGTFTVIDDLDSVLLVFSISEYSFRTTNFYFRYYSAFM